jgi:hypothetical protein
VQVVLVDVEPRGEVRRRRRPLGERVGDPDLDERRERLGHGGPDRLLEHRDLGRDEPVGEREQPRRAASTADTTGAGGGTRPAIR